MQLNHLAVTDRDPGTQRDCGIMPWECEDSGGVDTALHFSNTIHRETQLHSYCHIINTDSRGRCDREYRSTKPQLCLLRFRKITFVLASAAHIRKLHSLGQIWLEPERANQASDGILDRRQLAPSSTAQVARWSHTANSDLRSLSCKGTKYCHGAGI